MSPIQQIKENLSTALLIAAIGIIGGMNYWALETMQRHQSQAITDQAASTKLIWEKLDRVTALMIREADQVKGDIKDLQKGYLCLDRDTAELKERMKNHIEEWTRAGRR